MPTSSVVPLSDLLLYAVSSWNKKTRPPPPLVVLVQQTEKKQKIFAQWVPFSVPFGDCEKRTPLRSFRLSANQPSTGTPIIKYLRFTFLFFSPLF